MLWMTSTALAGHLVIVDGSKDKAEAEQALRLWSGATSMGWPRLDRSDDIGGLNPGFHIVTFGVFETASEAMGWSAHLNALGAKSYVREVELPATDALLEVETSLAVTFSDGAANLPLAAVASRSCQTDAAIGWSPTLPDGSAALVAPAGVDVCVDPKLSPAFVAEHGLTDCSTGAAVTCSSSMANPSRSYRAILVTPTPRGADTSEDWGWFPHDVAELAKDEGVPVLHLDGLVADVAVDGRTVARVAVPPSTALGYWFVAAGQAPQFKQHDLPSEVWSAAEAYFGL